MTYQHPTAWVGAYHNSDPARRKPKRYARKGYTERKPRYPFPIDFLTDERLLALLGALVRLHGLTEGEARIAAALLAGYTVEYELAGRVKLGVRTVNKYLIDVRQKLGVSSSAEVVAALWPTYARYRPQALLLLPRLDPALLELEPDDECFRRLLRRLGRRAEQAAD